MLQSFEYIVHDEVTPDEVMLSLNQTDWAQGQDEASVAKMIELGLVHMSLHNDDPPQADVHCATVDAVSASGRTLFVA